MWIRAISTRLRPKQAHAFHNAYAKGIRIKCGGKLVSRRVIVDYDALDSIVGTINLHGVSVVAFQCQTKAEYRAATKWYKKIVLITSSHQYGLSENFITTTSHPDGPRGYLSASYAAKRKRNARNKH